MQLGALGDLGYEHKGVLDAVTEQVGGPSAVWRCICGLTALPAGCPA